MSDNVDSEKLIFEIKSHLIFLICKILQPRFISEIVIVYFNKIQNRNKIWANITIF